METELSSRFILEFQQETSRLGYFFVKSEEWPNIFGCSEEEAQARANKALELVYQPVLAGSRQLFPFHHPEKASSVPKQRELLNEWLRCAGRLFTFDGRKWKFRPLQNYIHGFEGYWRYDFGSKDAVIALHAGQDIFFQEIFKSCSDPMLLTNPRAVVESGVHALAKKLTKDEESVAVILPAGGLAWVGVYARGQAMEMCSDLALNLCRRSQQMLLLYGKNY